MSLTHLPPGVLPESVMRLWHVQGASYSFQRVTHRTGRWYLPALKVHGELGVDLFFKQSEAMAIGELNLARMAAEAGVSPKVMGERLQAQRDPSRATSTRRVTVAPFSSVGQALSEVTRG